MSRKEVQISKQLQTFSDQAFAEKKPLEDGGLETLGELLKKNHEFLIKINHSNETLIHLCKKALEIDVLRAKVTGGGRGGYMNALPPPRKRTSG